VAAKFTLCSFRTCPWVQRAAIVLRAKNVPYDIVYIDQDKARRPDWFMAISPHGKVPVLKIDGQEALFESNAIAEYLDETIAPRLAPADPLARARNRAWTDYLPTFAIAVSLTSYANTAEAFDARKAKIPEPFARLDAALAKRGNDGPYFNGPSLSLVDAGYAPFLQRYTYTDRLHPLGLIERHPHLAAWRDALIAHPAVIASTVRNFEAVWQEQLIVRGRWLGRFVSQDVLGAAAAA
jgi:glutathione S-transferase